MNEKKIHELIEQQNADIKKLLWQKILKRINNEELQLDCSGKSNLDVKMKTENELNNENIIKNN